MRGALQNQLDLAGVEYLVDHRDCQAGENIKDWIVGAAGHASIILLILSPAYIESAWTSFERLLDMGAATLPVMLEACELPERLRRMKHLDFTGPDKPWKELRAALE